MVQMNAEPEYATAKIAVWWDMKGCPIPREGYDARRVRPSIEGALKELGYSGPVSITGYGDQRQTPYHILKGLSSTGVSLAHINPESIYSLMYSNMLEWREDNPPPASMMLISDQWREVFSWDLARLQQQTKYDFFLVYPSRTRACSALATWGEWTWESLLEPKSALVEDNCSSELPSAKFYCKSCCFECHTLKGFRNHLSRRKHAVQEVMNPIHPDLDEVTRMWGKNYAAKPEYATAQIAVWWDMIDCPIPEGYDPRQVRRSMEVAFKKLGYSGPVSITAFGDHKQTPDHILRGLSSTGVALAHTTPKIQYNRIFADVMTWQDHNPPPATIMIISSPDGVEMVFSDCLAEVQQRTKYNLFMAYSYRPYKMSVLLTSAEWLWESLLAETQRRVLQKCSLLQKCSERGECTKMFYCQYCFCECESLENFRKHLSSEKHASNEGVDVPGSISLNRYYHRLHLKAKVLESFPKTVRTRKAYRTGFGHLHNHLRLTYR